MFRYLILPLISLQRQPGFETRNVSSADRRRLAAFSRLCPSAHALRAATLQGWRSYSIPSDAGLQILSYVYSSHLEHESGLQ